MSNAGAVDLQDGGSIEVRGSGSSVYELRNVGGAYSCSCPAWRNQGRPAHQRTCKHLRAFRGDEAEQKRLQEAGWTNFEQAPAKVPAPKASGEATAQEIGVLLANSWDQASDPTGWWMSEKLDGVRAYWDGQRLISRLGNPFVAPRWFTESLPPHPLDGELWSGRKRFQRTVSIVRRQDASDEWKHIRYVVFDAPGLTRPFEERLQACREWLSGDSEVRQILEHRLCQGVEHLRQELARVESEGGEGLMLRRPGSLYEKGRSSTLLKVKSFRDAEAVVIGHQAGEGRHQGRLGALLVELQDGTRFAVGTGFSDREREEPPPLGSLITFRYQELSDGGVPRFPSYVGVRIDAVAPVKPQPQAKVPTTELRGETVARRFEFSEGSSSKFWEVTLEGSEMSVRFGRLGSAGQAKTRTFNSPADARREADKLVAEKVTKGYRECPKG